MNALLLEVTNLCPFSCRHCSRDRLAPPLHLPWDRFESLFSQAVDLGLTELSLTGGEPLAWPGFFRAFDHALAHRFRFGLVTNGWLFAETLEPFLRSHPSAARALALSFSLDGPDAETHDFFRRMPGSFDRIMKALAVCRELGVPVTIKSALWRGNTDKLLDLIALTRSFGAGLSLIFLTPTPELVAEKLIPEPMEYEHLFSHITSQLLPLFPGLAIEGICSLDQPIPLCNPFSSLPSLAFDGTATLCCNLSNVGSVPAASAPDSALPRGREYLGNTDKMPMTAIIERHLSLLPELASNWTDRPSNFWQRSCAACLRKFGKLEWLDSTSSPWRNIT